MCTQIDSSILTYRGLTVRLYPQHDLYVYVIHASRKLHHAQHYTGFTTNISARLALHHAGQGAKLTRAYNAAGIEYDLALLIRVENCAEGHMLERRLKAKHDASRYCPICRGLPVDDLVFLRQGHHRFSNFEKPGRRRPMPGGRL